MAFEKYIITSGSDVNMSLHLLKAIVVEYIAEQKTKAECLSAIENHLGVSLTSQEQTDLQNWMIAIDGQTKIENKLRVMEETYNVCVLASENTWYTTRELLKTRLSWAG